MHGAAATVVAEIGIVVAGMSGIHAAANIVKEGKCIEREDGNTGKIKQYNLLIGKGGKFYSLPVRNMGII